MRKRKNQQADDAPPPIDEAEPAPLPPVPYEDEPPPAPRAKAAPSRLRVVHECLANVNGSFTRLVAGQVLDPLGYSPSTIESLRAQGVKLEPAE